MSEEGISLVTGGCGFIGQHLVQALIDAGKPVRVLDINPPPESFSSLVDVHSGSILDKDLLKKAMKDVAVVYHLAAIPHLWTKDLANYQEINVEGTRCVIEAAQKMPVERFIYTSSETVLRGWRNRNSQPIDETQALPEPDELAGPYSISKLEAELLVWKAIDQGLPGIVLYPTIPIGAGDINLTAPTCMIRDFINGRNPAYLECKINLIPVKAVAAGHLLAAEKGKVGQRYILGQDNFEMSAFLQLLEKISGSKMPTRKVNYRTAILTAKAMELASRVSGKTPAASVEGVRLAGAKMTFDCSKARNELGLPQYAIPEALRQTIEWLKVKNALK